ncbi:hypothetical protein LOC68_22720 [Blastopirellula sp. JC732]|uniref:Uncharacterized protein n=1 Tax=Blastopirellula sediminis TaxID=2894196 RepID=A0A9X1MR60_9BACT|nr:hypothetical protein [Blastopirellula sediminis]MCC9605484.1 hypothetical protein [Blastopirellula sediminis]MCC9631216.1 hypothetical protein [Blastopirellula sediminis]
MRRVSQIALASFVSFAAVLFGACSSQSSVTSGPAGEGADLPGAAEEAAIDPPVAAEVPVAVPDDSQQLQELLKRRVQHLSRGSKMLENQYEGGIVPMERLLEAREKLTEAEIEAAETPEARVAALEKLLVLAKQDADVAKTKFESGTASSVDMELALAAATTVEIKLLLAKRELKAP